MTIIRTEPNENLIVELKSIRDELNLHLSGPIEQKITEIAHAVCMVIDALIDAEEQE